jgi:hypothetical protein
MIIVTTSVQSDGLLSLWCNACQPRPHRFDVPIDDPIGCAAIVRAFVDHARVEHGAGRDFSREGGGQDTRRPVFSLPPGAIATNSSEPTTVRDDACRNCPGPNVVHQHAVR